MIRQDVIGPRPDPTQVPYFVSRVTYRKSTTKENKKGKPSYIHIHIHIHHVISFRCPHPVRRHLSYLFFFPGSFPISLHFVQSPRLDLQQPQRSRSSRGRVAAFPPVIIVHTVTFRHQIHFPAHRISLGQRSSPAQFPQF